MEGKPRVYFVLGGPGVGKGTQCLKLVEKYHFVHLSAGDLLREERKSGSANGDLIESCIKEGKIVPSHITVQLLENAMNKNGLNKTFLIDGFPRNYENLNAWLNQMGSKIEFKALLFFDCDEEIMLERLLKRSEISGRVDDNKESIIKRFNTYKQETKPIIDYFSDQSQTIKIDGSGTQEQVFQEVDEKLKSIQ